MEQNIKDLLAKVPSEKVIATQGFLKQNKADLPNAIVNYIIVYAFLWINEWFKGGSGWIIDETRLIARISVDAPRCTIYANPEITQGKHEWKIKLNQGQFQGWGHKIYIGIASSTDCLDAYHYGSASAIHTKVSSQHLIISILDTFDVFMMKPIESYIPL